MAREVAAAAAAFAAAAAVAVTARPCAWGELQRIL